MNSTHDYYLQFRDNSKTGKLIWTNCSVVYVCLTPE